MITINTTRDYIEEECIVCGCEFAVTKLYQDRRREDHRAFHCPNGHSQVYSGKSETEKLREEKARLTHQLDQERAARATAEAKRAKAERKVKRVEKGICPHCNRSFENLARHMECKHAKVTA